MLTFKLGEIKQIANAFNSIIKNDINIQLSWELSEILYEIIEKEKLYSIKLQEIVDNFAEKDETGKFIYTENKEGIKLQKDQIQKYNETINVLNNINTTIDKSPISLKDLIKENIKISPVSFYIIKDFIVKE
jgi:hypothetical protein